MKPKLKIVYIDEEEWKRSDEELIDTIKKQNKSGIYEESNMRIVKRVKNQSDRRGKTEGIIIIEVDERTHELMLNRGKINIGWKRCPVFNHISQIISVSKGALNVGATTILRETVYEM